MKDFLIKFTVNATAPVFGLFLSLWLIWNVETRFFPVVDHFTVQSITKSDAGYTAYGELTKSRSCEFLGLTLYAIKGHQPKFLVGQFKKDIFGSDVGTGYQTWGPWTMKLPAELALYDKLEIQGTHRCHGLWMQSTTYHVLDLSRLPK